MRSLQVDVAGEPLQLFADRAIYWPRTQTLVIADVHLGKPSAFGSAGIPVPEQVTIRDLARLSALLEETQARRLLVLGDLFHARTGQSASTIDAFETWRRRHPALPIVLTVGNHDAGLDNIPQRWEIQSVREIYEPPFYLAHRPAGTRRGFGLFGHVHPSLRSAGMRLPCFYFSGSSGLLPAFGGFTGTFVISPKASDRVYAISSDEILQIPAILLGR